MIAALALAAALAVVPPPAPGVPTLFVRHDVVCRQDVSRANAPLRFVCRDVTVTWRAGDRRPQREVHGRRAMLAAPTGAVCPTAVPELLRFRAVVRVAFHRGDAHGVTRILTAEQRLERAIDACTGEYHGSAE